MKYHKLFGLGLLLFGAISCQNIQKTPDAPMDQAQALIDQAISLHGGALYDNSDIQLSFRDKHYRSIRRGSAYQYERSFESEGDVYQDIMTHDSFVRKINQEVIAVPDTMIRKYRNSINSVWYFALLPYKLNDAAVYKKYLGIATLDGQSYHKIQVTFAEEGGGEDHQDVFIYFISEKSGELDHLAYSYETDGGGVRFRKGYNFRRKNGMRFADYINFKGDPKMPVQQIDLAYTQGKLDTLSYIELQNIQVSELTE